MNAIHLDCIDLELFLRGASVGSSISSLLSFLK